MSRTAFRAGSTVRRSNLSDRRIAGNSRATSTELVARLSGVTSRWSTRVLGARQDPCRGTVVSLSLDPGHAQHPRWDDAADRDGTVTGVRCARRAPFRGRRCSWSPEVTSSSCARLFLPCRRVLRTRRSPVPVAHRRLLPGRCVRRARAHGSRLRSCASRHW